MTAPDSFFDYAMEQLDILLDGLDSVLEAYSLYGAKKRAEEARAAFNIRHEGYMKERKDKRAEERTKREKARLLQLEKEVERLRKLLDKSDQTKGEET